MKKVVILGAGLSGLGCALRLPGAPVFEAENHPGGLAYSHCFDGIWYDRGAHIAHSRDPAWIEMISRAAGEIVEIRPSRVSNYWHGRWVTYPVQNHLAELPENVRKPALDGFLAAQEKYRDAVPRNYREWCLFQYGEYLTDHFYAEYTRKYWRVPMEELATDWLSGRLLPGDIQRVMKGATSSQEDNQAAFAAFRYPARGGFFAFVKPFYEGVPVRYGHRACKVDAVRRTVTFENGARESYEALASSIPLPELVQMIEDAPASVLAAASVLRTVQEVCVNMVIARPKRVPHHWFYIYDNDVEPSRVAVINNIVPSAAPQGQTVLQAEVFRREDEKMPVDELAEKAVRDLSRVLGFDPVTDVVSVNSVPIRRSYVVSDLRRASAVAAIVPWLREREIHTMGLFGMWKYVWSDVAFRAGEQTAESILALK